MTKIKALRERLDSWGIIFFIGAVYLTSQAAIGYILHAVGPDRVLKIQTTLSAAVVRGMLDEWHSSGLINEYLRHYYFDFLHPVWYGVFLAALLSKLFNNQRVSHKYDMFLLLPFLAGLCDLIENVSHIAFIFYSCTVTPLWVGISGSAALLKWALVALSLAMILVLMARSIKSQRRYV